MNDDKTVGKQVTIRPATPLPWAYSVRKGDDVSPASVYHLKHEGHAYAVAMCPRYGAKSFKKDGPYIVHAANAYPKLVERMKRDCGVLEARGAFGEVDVITALLRELGEAK